MSCPSGRYIAVPKPSERLRGDQHALLHFNASFARLHALQDPWVAHDVHVLGSLWAPGAAPVLPSFGIRGVP